MEPNELVFHAIHGVGVYRKTHKNGRASVHFEGQLLPKTVDPEEIRPWSDVLTGSDYE